MDNSSFVSHRRDGCPAQGPGPPANGAALQLEATETKVPTPINLVGGELSIMAASRGGGTGGRGDPGPM